MFWKRAEMSMREGMGDGYPQIKKKNLKYGWGYKIDMWQLYFINK